MFWKLLISILIALIILIIKFFQSAYKSDWSDRLPIENDKQENKAA